MQHFFPNGQPMPNIVPPAGRHGGRGVAYQFEGAVAAIGQREEDLGRRVALEVTRGMREAAHAAVDAYFDGDGAAALPHDKLDIPLAAILDPRTANALEKAGLTHVRHVYKLTDAEFTDMRRVGAGAVVAIRRALRGVGV